MYQEKGTVYIEEDDQCATCEYYKTGIACPLLEALSTGIAALTESVGVKHCGFYVKHEKRLKVVKDA